MGELGSWNKDTLEIEYKKTLNEIEHLRITRQRTLLDKQEQELKVKEYDVRVEEIDKKLKVFDKTLEWFAQRFEATKND